MKTQKEELGKVSLTCNGLWDRNKRYDRLCLVYNEDGSYISKKDVPKNTSITDEEFWQPVVKNPNIIIDGGNIDLSNYITKAYLNECLKNYITNEYFREVINGISETYVDKSNINNIILNYISANLKTINGTSLIGEGDIVIESGGSGNNPGGGTGGDNPVIVDPTYTPTVSESTAVTNEIGSIAEGTILGELKGKTFSKLIDMMLIAETWYDPKYKHTIGMTKIPELVKVGSTVQYPLVTALWNQNITPNEGVDTSIDVEYSSKMNDVPFTWGSEKIYNKSGNAIFAAICTYGSGSYEITSNLGNTKTIPVIGLTAPLRTSVDITYPWFINETEQPLVKIGTSYNITKVMGGQPSIKVPFANSEITVQVDLGFGFMDVEWNETIDNSNLGGAIDETVPYKVLTKPDSYSNDVPHKITIKLIK